MVRWGGVGAGVPEIGFGRPSAAVDEECRRAHQARNDTFQRRLKRREAQPGRPACDAGGSPGAAGGVSFAVLGPFEVRVGGALVALTGRQRSVLAVLVLNANRVVAVAQIADALWGNSPPAAPEARVRGLIAELRRALAVADGDGPIVTRQPGYLVRVAPGQLDLDDFQCHTDQAAQAVSEGRPAQAIVHYDEALERWRGTALAGVAGPFVDGHATRLEEQRLRAVEERTETMLTVGRHAELVAELTRVVTEYPLRERPHAQLMLALYRGGRRGDALAVYRLLRARLVEELGVEPTPHVHRLHTRMLAGDPSLQPERHTEPESDRAARRHPARLGSFVGHQAELEQLDAIAASGAQLALVAGAAGAGKTALARRWAHQSVPRFPDGQLFVDMRGFHTGLRLSPVDALPLLLIGLGIPADKVPIAVDSQAALYRSALVGRRVLVILDNVADPDQVRPLLPSVPGCLVLVTSRDRLSGLLAVDGAHRITLDVLPAADSVAVLADIAGRDRFDADPDAAAELARLCGHLPLALRIAGARLADRPDLGLRECVEEFSARGPMSHLQVDGDDTATVRSAFDLSYKALTPQARRVFRLLGVVPATAGLTLPAVAALSGLPENEVEPSVAALARFHLVNLTASGRLVCQDLLLHYAARLAREQDSSTDRAAAVDRLLHFYLHSTDLAARPVSACPNCGCPGTTSRRSRWSQAQTLLAEIGVPGDESVSRAILGGQASMLMG